MAEPCLQIEELHPDVLLLDFTDCPLFRGLKCRVWRLELRKLFDSIKRH